MCIFYNLWSTHTIEQISKKFILSWLTFGIDLLNIRSTLLNMYLHLTHILKELFPFITCLPLTRPFLQPLLYPQQPLKSWTLWTFLIPTFEVMRKLSKPLPILYSRGMVCIIVPASSHNNPHWKVSIQINLPFNWNILSP